MVLAGLREGYPRNFQGYPSLKPASTISTNIPRNIPGNTPPLARAIRVKGQGSGRVAVNAYVGQKYIELTSLELRRQKFGDCTWMEMHRSDFDFLAS